MRDGIPRPRDAPEAGPDDGERMGASSGWNLVARRPSRTRLCAKRPARHLVSVPPAHDSDKDASAGRTGASAVSEPGRGSETSD